MKISPFRMEEQLLQYFQGEKFESVFFLGIAIVAMIVSFYLITSESDYRWIAVPLLVIGVVQFVVGATVLVRTNKQVTKLTAQLGDEPDTYRAAEMQRMATVERNFKIYKIVEIALILGGIALTYLFRTNVVWYAIGIGLIAQGTVTLLCDLFAERRADLYVEVLRTFS